MKKYILAIIASVIVGVGFYTTSLALSTSTVIQGGTGSSTSTPSALPVISSTTPFQYSFPINGPQWDWANVGLKSPIEDYGGQVYNVKAYGAKGDGSTNDTTAFNAATLAAHNAGAGNIFIPSGNFKLSTSPTLYNGVSMFGAGSTSLITLANGASINATGVSNVSFDNFAIDGSLHTSAGNYGLLLTNVTNVYVTRMNIVNMTCFGIFINASASNTTDNVHIDNSYIQGKGNCDVIGGGPNNSTGAIVKNVFVTNNKVVQDCTVGTYCNAFDLVAETGFHVTGNTFYGIVQPGSEQFPHTNIDFSHNFINPAISKVTTALYVSTNASSTASSSFVTLAYNQIASGTLETFGVASGTVTNVDVSHNIITPGALQSCIVFQYVSGGSVSSNQCHGGTIGIDFATSTNFNVYENYLDSNNYGIRVDDISSSTIKSGINFITNSLNTKTSGLQGIVIAGDDTTNSIPLTISNSANNDTLRLTNTSGFNRAVLSFYDPSRNDPAGMFQIQDSGDTLTFYRGSLGTSARAKFSMSSSANVIESGIGLQGITNGVFNGVNSALFQSSGTSFINAGGNLGIGTSSPTSVLFVQASSTSSSTLFTLASSTGATLFNVDGAGTTTITSLGTGCVGVTSGTLYTTPCGGGLGTTTPFTSGFIPMATSTSIVLSDSVIFQSGAKVSIGSSSPAATLQVNAALQTSGAGTADVLYLDRPFNNGVFRGRRASLKVGATSAVSDSFSRMDIALTSGGLLGNSQTSPDITVLTMQGNNLSGFGSTTPNATLVVQGTSSNATLPILLVASSSGASLLLVTPTGRVGIGTTVPASLLDVNGNIMSNGGSAGHATCWKADGRTIGYCSSVVDVTGSCTCN